MAAYFMNVFALACLALIAAAEGLDCTLFLRITEGEGNRVRSVDVIGGGSSVDVQLPESTFLAGSINAAVSIADDGSCPTSADAWVSLLNSNPVRITSAGAEGVRLTPNPVRVQVNDPLVSSIIGENIEIFNSQFTVEGGINPGGSGSLNFRISQGNVLGLDLAGAGSSSSAPVFARFFVDNNMVKMVIQDLQFSLFADVSSVAVEVKFTTGFEAVSDMMAGSGDSQTDGSRRHAALRKRT